MNTIQLRDSTTATDVRLDRLVSFDPRSRNFPIRAALAPTLKPRSYTWTVGQWLDQGSEGACVGFAWSHELAARPVQVNGLDDRFAREKIYHDAQRLDEWEGGSYPGATPVYEGTSVLAGAKVCKQRNYIAEYRWAFSLEDVRFAIGYKGPVVLGVNWYSGMFNIDTEGYVRVKGSLSGGHAILAYSNNEKMKRIGLWNSWGHTWGNNGACFITYDDLDRLLHEQGEACIPALRAAP